MVGIIQSPNHHLLLYFVESMEPSKPHIRPKVSSRAKKVEAPADDIDQLLEETQKRLDSWLTVGEAAKQPSREKQPAVEDAAKPVGILKKPKYTNKTTASASTVVVEKTVVKSEPQVLDDGEHETVDASTSTTNPAVKHFVVERDPSTVKPQLMPNMDPRAVEGYTPKSEGEDDKDVVISSLSDLMEKAGMLPDQDSTEAPQVVEANLEFSVMSKQEYEEEEGHEEEEKPDQPAEAFQGRFDVFSDDDDDDDDPVFSDFMTDADDRIEETPAAEPRAFINLWETLSAWVTPEAVELLKEWHEGDTMEVSPDWVPVVDTSEIAASRCAGLMALLNMNLRRSLKELGHPSDVDRVAKHRLADLLRTFNYSRPTARLDTGMWRAMTCVLLCIVLSKKDDKSIDTPASAAAVGIAVDEYTYLTQSCFKSLAAGL
jgi:hypothetical protein